MNFVWNSTKNDNLALKNDDFRLKLMICDWKMMIFDWNWCFSTKKFMIYEIMMKKGYFLLENNDFWISKNRTHSWYHQFRDWWRLHFYVSLLLLLFDRQSSPFRTRFSLKIFSFWTLEFTESASQVVNLGIWIRIKPFGLELFRPSE